MANEKLNIEDYLEMVGRFRQNKFGKQFRSQFVNTRGTSELAMLTSPSEDEYQQFVRIVKVMTESEKLEPELLTDEMIKDIAQSADAESANASIFINGFVLHCKRAASTKDNK